MIVQNRFLRPVGLLQMFDDLCMILLGALTNIVSTIFQALISCLRENFVFFMSYPLAMATKILTGNALVETVIEACLPDLN